MGAFHAIFGR